MKSPEAAESIIVGGVNFSHGDIRNVVENFYGKVAVDPVLKVPFRTVEDWPHHIERLTHFWWIRFGGEPYLVATYNPVEKHFHAGFNSEFLNHWLQLFKETLSENLRPEQVQLWGSVADRMGQALTFKNEMYRHAMESKS